MKIAHREIGPTHPPLVIAEIGINHGGDLAVAKEMVRLAAASGCEVTQYTPNQVKDAVAGWGGADKQQVQKMVQSRLGLSTLPKPADAADAAALALTHLAMSPVAHRLAAAGGRGAAGGRR